MTIENIGLYTFYAVGYLTCSLIILASVAGILYAHLKIISKILTLVQNSQFFLDYARLRRSFKEVKNQKFNEQFIKNYDEIERKARMYDWGKAVKNDD